MAGQRQSPIDVPAAPAGDLPKLSFHYQVTPLAAENNGHTIEVKVAAGSYLRIGTERFDLVQFHFHTPSEHRLHGEQFPMELHFVHRNALDEIAVVGEAIDGEMRTFRVRGQNSDFTNTYPIFA